MWSPSTSCLQLWYSIGKINFFKWQIYPFWIFLQFLCWWNSITLHSADLLKPWILFCIFSFVLYEEFQVGLGEWVWGSKSGCGAKTVVKTERKWDTQVSVDLWRRTGRGNRRRHHPCRPGVPNTSIAIDQEGSAGWSHDIHLHCDVFVSIDPQDSQPVLTFNCVNLC